MTIRKVKGSLVKVEIDDYICESTYLFYDTITGCIRIADGTPGGKPACIEGLTSTSSFSTIAVSGQGDVVATSALDTLTLVAGANITITTNPGTDEITIASSGGGAGDPDQNLWETISSDSGSTVANTLTDTLTVTGGTGINTAIVGDVLTITATGGAGSDELSKVSVNDTTPGFLNGKLVSGTGITLTENNDGANETLTIAYDSAASDQNLFSTIAVSGQSNVVADTATDTLTLVAGTNVTITTNAGTDEITINSAAGGAGDPDQNLWETVSGDSGSAVANTITDTLTIAGGDGITTAVSGDTLTITNDDAQIYNTFVNITTVTTVDSVVAEMGKWIIRIIENGTPTNVLTEEILATHDGTNPKFTEYAILKMGSNITGLSIDVTLTGGNTLNVTVTSTPGVDVQIKQVAVF